MRFIIDQIAVCPHNPARAQALLEALGLSFTALDHVTAQGHVFGHSARNEADLRFAYQTLKGPLEVEILHYTDGPNWMNGREGRVSHIGMHVTRQELEVWETVMAGLGIREAQAVRTLSHTNPTIRDTRRYNYAIFDTHDLIGVDLKFIVRDIIALEGE